MVIPVMVSWRSVQTLLLPKLLPVAHPSVFNFTYNVPPGGERNSSGTLHSYVVSTVCDGLFPVNFLSFIAAQQADGTVAVNWSTERLHVILNGVRNLLQ